MELGTPPAMEERLDRALANQAWFELFPNVTLKNLVVPASDHYPIMLNHIPMACPHLTNCSFRFENAWKLELGFDVMVKECWLTYSEDSLLPRQHSCAEEMVVWSRNHCNKLKIEIEECRRNLNLARSSFTGDEQHHLIVLRKRMHRLLARDDAYW